MRLCLLFSWGRVLGLRVWGEEEEEEDVGGVGIGVGVGDLSGFGCLVESESSENTHSFDT